MSELRLGAGTTAIVQPSVTTPVQQTRTVKMVLDGSWHGPFRVTCECGTEWNGCATVDGLCEVLSPTRPVAEAAAHRQLEHRGDRVEIQFTTRFCSWLVRYWDSLNTTDFSTATR